MRSRRATTAAAASLALLAPALLPPSAQAEAGNDRVEDAYDLGRLPVAVEPSLADATADPSDPALCWSGPTVWYSLTAPRDGVLRLEAFQSAFDGPQPALGAVSGEPGDLAVEGCAVYDETRGVVSPRVEVPVEAGQRLLVVLGTAGTVSPASPYVALTGRYLTGKPQVDVTVRRRATVAGGGTARVSGTLRCAEPTEATVTVRLRQPAGGRPARANASRPLPCTSTRVSWTLPLRATGPRLHAGRARVVVRTVATGELGRTAVRTARAVRLARQPARPGGRLAFSRGNQVFTMDADGTDARRLTSAGKNYRPRWSPDGRRIAYLHEGADGATDVWVMRADGTGRQQVTTTGTVEAAAAWSPDGRWLLFGSPLQRVSSTAPFSAPEVLLGRYFPEDPEADSLPVDRHLAWSPSGRFIAYYSHSYPSSPDSYLLLLDRETGLVRPLAEVGGACCGEGFYADLEWGPDDSVLAFTEQYYGWEDPDYATYVRMMALGGGPAPAYRTVAEDAQPAISPSGGSVAVVNGATGTAWIYVTAADGTARRVLGRGYHPDWRP